MESTVDLLLLPEEVLQYLCIYLSMRDVLSFSGTCRHLQSALNYNSVWRRYLPSLEISCLQTQFQHVESSFEHNLQSCCYPICSAKLLIMKKMQLLNNWRHGKYVCKSAKTDFSYSSGVLNKPRGHGSLFYEHKYIFNGRFINDVHSDAIEVWNVENEPALHCALPMEDFDYDSFYIIGNYLVVIICRKVDVYEINLSEKGFTMKYSFIITDDFVLYNSHACRHDFNCVGWSHSNVEHYLLSNKCGEDPCALHVWDILNATKTGTFLSPIHGFSIRFHSVTENAWVFSQIFQSGHEHNYYSFDIKTKEFSDNYFNLKSFCVQTIFYLSNVLVFSSADDAGEGSWCDAICSLFDFNSSVKLKDRRFNNSRQGYNIHVTSIFNGEFILLCTEGFKLVDALSLEIVDTIECVPMVRSIKSHYNLYGHLFVLATSSSNNGLELWDIKKKIKISDFLKTDYCNHLYFDDLATKVVMFNYYKIVVAHFW